MMRLKERREWIAKQEERICPRILKILEKLKDDSRNYAVCSVGNNLCEVSSNNKE